MKITARDVVPDGTPDDDALIRGCADCEIRTFFVPQRVMVLSAGGARSMRLWACKDHPLPHTITDIPDPEENS